MQKTFGLATKGADPWLFLRSLTFSSSLHKIISFLKCDVTYFASPAAKLYLLEKQTLPKVHPGIFLKSKPQWYRVACCYVSWPIVITAAIVGMAFNLKRFISQ